MDNIDRFDGLAKDCGYSIANALELLQSCAKPAVSNHNKAKQCTNRVLNSWNVLYSMDYVVCGMKTRLQVSRDTSR